MSDLTFTYIKISIDQDVLTLTLNRPEKLNALHPIMIQEIDAVFEEIVPLDSIKGVILIGEGDKAFAAGADIKAFQGLTSEEAQILSQEGQSTFLKIAQCAKPVIAAVNGFALGGGLELALAAHIRIASAQAQIGLPETTLGLVPGYGGTQRLTNLVGRGRALQLMLTAQRIDASTALEWGIFNAVVSPSDVLTTSKTWMLQILKQAPIALRECIRLVLEAELSGGQAMPEEAKSFGRCSATSDFIEGTTAFLEKRPPVFKGK
ncbi:MAG: enoyl-CoA hydratase-related protein [Cytophagaceae bacterium]|jgi:enoyl-CoA hydratase|nr:enoyl-CoA hydratase-related protein [Cytophagaceae bacterium]